MQAFNNDCFKLNSQGPSPTGITKQLVPVSDTRQGRAAGAEGLCCSSITKSIARGLGRLAGRPGDIVVRLAQADELAVRIGLSLLVWLIPYLELSLPLILTLIYPLTLLANEAAALQLLPSLVSRLTWKDRSLARPHPPPFAPLLHQDHAATCPCKGNLSG